MNWEPVLKNIRKELKTYVTENNLKALVLGVSGGIDSALVVAIARPVCDELGIKLIGRSLPHNTNKDEEVARATGIGQLCHDFETIGIASPFDGMFEMCQTEYSKDEDDRFNKIATGNIKARVRMVYLYDLAYRNRGLVLSTDNLTELLVGFWTLHGDVGDYGFIQQLWKTEVYDLAKWLCEHELKGNWALQACIDAIPTDGLGITSSDLEQLGAKTYNEVDVILKTWLTKDEDNFAWDDWLEYEGRIKDYAEFAAYRETLKDHPVVRRYEKTHFKRANPLNLTREQIFHNDADWVDTNE